MAILFIPILLGVEYLYHWSHMDAVEHDHLLAHKYPYLNVYFFVIRIIIYFIAWISISYYYSASSFKQDSALDKNYTAKMQKKSVWVIFIYALTLTFFSFDVLMSLTPHWYSTIYGVYYFSISVICSLAFIIPHSALAEAKWLSKRFH